MHHAEAGCLSNKLLNDHHLEISIIYYCIPTFTFGVMCNSSRVSLTNDLKKVVLFYFVYTLIRLVTLKMGLIIRLVAFSFSLADIAADPVPYLAGKTGWLHSRRHFFFCCARLLNYKLTDPNKLLSWWLQLNGLPMTAVLNNRDYYSKGVSDVGIIIMYLISRQDSIDNVLQISLSLSDKIGAAHRPP